ncbi:MAG: pantoate--beta-alanine ligase [Clostridiales bacterium]|nr:pantoate--beta-alanine ligase [Clostridiales bacterium]
MRDKPLDLTKEQRVIKSPRQIQELAFKLRSQGDSIGLVPTMGALHEGHLSLVRAAREENKAVIVSVFVNPGQFGPHEDFNSYPRNLEQDTQLALKAGADLIFAPAAADIYPDGYQNFVAPGPLAQGLCGAKRPGHFRGVCTVVLKLLQLTAASRAYFGQKDAQQLRVIQQMAKDFDLEAQIKGLPIVREADGLALSSRNIYLNEEERQQSTILFQSLRLAQDLIAAGQRETNTISRQIKQHINQAPLARLDYLEIVDWADLQPLKQLTGQILIALAVYFGATRLIDNIILDA